MCGGFTCSKNSLIALNLLYVLVSAILISVAAYAKVASIVTSLTVVSGIAACGIFLLLISVVGIIGASKHHQVMLFFYMIILFFIFVIQFSFACACLAFNEEQQHFFAEEGWRHASIDIKSDAQHIFGCCGYYNATNYVNDTLNLNHPSCLTVHNQDKLLCCPGNTTEENCCQGKETVCNCSPCEQEILAVIGRGLSTSGGIGLFFSFTEFLGVWLTVRYRNQRDPRANPSAFL